MKPTDEQIARLPKWAQDEMRNLMMRVDELTSKLSDAIDAPESRVMIDPYASGPTGKVRYLPEGETVRFALTEHEWIDFQLQEDILRREDLLKGVKPDLFVHVCADQQLSVDPRSSNVVHLRRRT